MSYPTRIYYTEADKALMWDRSQKGKSLTWDRSKELADHRRFSLATDINVYSRDPQQPWQRG